MARSVAGRPAPIGDATPGKSTASRSGRTGKVIRSDMISPMLSFVDYGSASRTHRLCHEKTPLAAGPFRKVPPKRRDRKSTRLNSSHLGISYAVFCLKKKKQTECIVNRQPAYNAMI